MRRLVVIMTSLLPALAHAYVNSMVRTARPPSVDHVTMLAIDLGFWLIGATLLHRLVLPNVLGVVGATQAPIGRGRKLFFFAVGVCLLLLQLLVGLLTPVIATPDDWLNNCGLSVLGALALGLAPGVIFALHAVGFRRWGERFFTTQLKRSVALIASALLMAVAVDGGRSRLLLSLTCSSSTGRPLTFSGF